MSVILLDERERNSVSTERSGLFFNKPVDQMCRNGPEGTGRKGYHRIALIVNPRKDSPDGFVIRKDGNRPFPGPCLRQPLLKGGDAAVGKGRKTWSKCLPREAMTSCSEGQS